MKKFLSAVLAILTLFSMSACTSTKVHELLDKNGELKGYVPDIAIIGFGMNDATLGLSIDTFCNNIMSMIKTIREKNADCEIILLGTMLANPMAKNQSKNQTEYTEYLVKTVGVKVADVMSIK